jgi:hypothetical protein
LQRQAVGSYQLRVAEQLILAVVRNTVSFQGDGRNHRRTV